MSLNVPRLQGLSSRSGLHSPVDTGILIVVLALILLGLVMVYSASVALPESPQFRNYSPWHFITRQMIFVGVSIAVAVVVFLIPMQLWQKHAKLIFLLALFLLVIVLIPQIGYEVKGAYRWIRMGSFNLQPSEVMKLAVILYVADFSYRKQGQMHLLTKGFLPMIAVMSLTSWLLLMEPDLGAFVVISGVTMGIIFLAGISLKYLGAVFFGVAVAFSSLVLAIEWRRERFLAYLEPWKAENMAGAGYQLMQSLVAYARGETFGVGLGGSIQKLYYLPEAHNDFIMAVIGEELGFVGVLSVLIGFYYLVRRSFQIGRLAIMLEHEFSGLVAKGVGILLSIQIFINVGVTLGVLPTKGLTLPFISYGGSGLLMSLCGMAILLRVDFENKRMMRDPI